MPYVPSKKTDNKSTDREVLDVAIDNAATQAVDHITNNFSVVRVYTYFFTNIAARLNTLLAPGSEENKPKDPGSKYGPEHLASVIYEVGKKYDYEGALLGELNYAITRFIQVVPKKQVESKNWEKELRYWLYVCTVQALLSTASENSKNQFGIGGVFEDIKDEYKRRVNTAYEAGQIVKSGDCYDTPYYTRLVEVVDGAGTHIGYQEVMLKRSDETVTKDILPFHVVLR